MKKIRIGNDIVVTWSIHKDGQPYSLDGMELSLFLGHAFGKRKIESYSVRGNKITWTFLGKEQKHTGKYSLELVINEGQEGMATTDVCDFVYLTPVTPCCAGDDDEEVITESIELDSSMAFAPAVIREGGAGLQYAIERTVYPTRGISYGEDLGVVAELSEEERAYNIETCRMAFDMEPIFLSFEGSFLPLLGFSEIASDPSFKTARFGILLNLLTDIDSISVTITGDGDAVVEVKAVDTGSAPSAPRDMNNDFSKDF